MSYHDLLTLYFDRSNALQWYWTLYVIIVGGLLAFSSLRTRRDLVTGILVTVLFCFFTWKNCGAIGDVTLQRQALVQTIRSSPGPAGTTFDRHQLESTLVSPDWENTRNFHIASDILTVLAVWAMEWRRIRSSRATSGAPAAH